MSKSLEETFGVELTHAAGPLRRVALALTRDPTEAADLVQETLLKGWAARSRFEPGTHLMAWLGCIMRNTFLTEIRRKARDQAVDITDYVDVLGAPATQERAIMAKAVSGALAALPCDQAEAIVHVGVYGETYGAAAARLGCAEGTLKSRVSRGRQTMRHHFGDADLFA